MFVKVHDYTQIDEKFIKVIEYQDDNDEDLPNEILDRMITIDMLVRVEKHLKERYPDFELIDFKIEVGEEPFLQFYLLDKAYYDSPLRDGYGGKK